MWYTGIDPMSGEEVQTARYLRDREVQRALMQFFKPENWFDVRDALVAAGRQDLIGGGCDALIPATPPKEADEARRKRAQETARRGKGAAGQGGEPLGTARVENDHYHTVANPAKGEAPGERGAGPVKPTGYRPGRMSAKRRHKS